MRRGAHSQARARYEAAAQLAALFDGAAAVGLQYGPGYRCLERAWSAGGEALSRLQVRSTSLGTQVHPADLDDALCTSAVMASSGGGGETRLPFAVDDALLQGALGELWAVRALQGPIQHPVPVLSLAC